MLTRMKIFSAAVWMRSLGFCGRAGAGTKKRMRSTAWFIAFSAFFSPRRSMMLPNSWLLAASQHWRTQHAHEHIDDSIQQKGNLPSAPSSMMRSGSEACVGAVMRPTMVLNLT